MEVINQRRRSLWVEHLGEEDLAFMKRFMLASGSLKKMAAEYGVSYPTVRLRLDRLIEKIKIYDSDEVGDDFEKLLGALYADGKLNSETFRRLRQSYQSQKDDAYEDHRE